ncbi:hypothetical protein POM88_043454 [Heracleum sosnowskyi]|uniref:Uncharacterized protein n=1 Tax=Heracleum sosnowskyi TaxID=360622 RepID=A0AAD8M219_9APIA|nr:hypothetical protein POM88_043454 [Heracleum sosnowskyi]
MESDCGKLEQESLLSNVFNYQNTMMKEHLHIPKDQNSLKSVIEEFNFETSFMKEHNPGQPKQTSVHHKFTRRWTAQSHLDEKTKTMKDSVSAQEFINTTNPLTPNTPRGTAGPFKVATQPRRKGPAIQNRKNHSTPMFNDPTIYFYDDCDDEFYEFQKNGRIGSNIDKGKQPIDIPPRTLDFNEIEREGNTSDYQPDIDYSYVADMLSDQSDGDSEDEELQHDVDYDAYDMLNPPNNGNYLFLNLQ